ncbi:hypothetical protein HN51_025738 [Arachis hypogaea]|uniref:Peptidase A1 domain-containing protein n=1 Tax=Arachis hypogaea TaxID=3818 RepID=A0A445CF05_ARAHY|nr:aspartic proteinase NANA, chloroplast [Arachis hypogaea]QHO28238.1 Protein ASPARTIC PROTEASE IN GUARD CELL [Arachis hypogaea]RYR49509.1 hypothetical protein Ahy_A07g036020 isoform B [Arachis hypogaea]
MQMRMRMRMQWRSGTAAILIIIIIITITSFNIAHGGGYQQNDIDDGKEMRIELVHRHDSRFFRNRNSDNNGALDQLEYIKGFIQRDAVRRQRMNERWSISTNNKKHNLNNRRQNYETFEMPMQSGRDNGLGEYFVQVEVGTPGQKFWVVADTGNELTWFNCLDKKPPSVLGAHKKRHRRTRPRSRTRSSRRTKRRRRRIRRPKNTTNKQCGDGVFCPQHSKSFEAVTCSSLKCKFDLSDLFSLTYCPRPSDPCLYDISYVDGSSAKGFFGTDTITVDLTSGKQGKLENLTIGCTNSMLNGVTFNEDTSGILGLGYSKESFVDKATLQYGGKFSYCLVDHLSHRDVSSHLFFGNHNVTTLSEIKRTELFLIPPLYGVNVIGISIGDQMLKIPPQVWDFNSQGGAIVDSGTTLTTLVDQAYGPVFEALNKSLANVKLADGDFGPLELCFDTSQGYDESVVPRLVFHFSGGVTFEPPLKSYIIDAAPQVKCLGIVETTGPGANVIGNIMQQNHLWEFDLSLNTVGFAPSSCN